MPLRYTLCIPRFQKTDEMEQIKSIIVGNYSKYGYLELGASQSSNIMLPQALGQHFTSLCVGAANSLNELHLRGHTAV